MTHYKKTYTNHFRPGLFDITMDYCDVTSEKSAAAKFSLNALKTLLPTVYQQYKENVKSCPLLVIENAFFLWTI
jgi:hypothetical protein